MTIVATPFGAAVVCGICHTRYEFAPSYDRRLPIADAIAAGWETARTDKGTYDHICPDCLAARAIEGLPIAVPDDPPLRNEPQQVEGATKPQPHPPSIVRKPPINPTISWGQRAFAFALAAERVPSLWLLS